MDGATLTYDSLPANSDIRFVYEPDAVHITAPASEPSPAVLKQALYDSFARGSISSSFLLALSYIGFHFGIRTNHVTGPSLVWAWGFFAIFCGALVLLVSWVSYSALIDAVRAGREQMTILVATPQRLLVETVGPFGAVGYNIPSEQIRRIRVTRKVMRDDHYRIHRAPSLSITLHDGRTLLLLPARERGEIACVAAALSQVLPTRRAQEIPENA